MRSIIDTFPFSERPSATDKILEKFPYSTIQPILGRPEYETITSVHLKLNTNVASVHSNMGMGCWGYCFLL